MGSEAEEDDGVPFEEKMKLLTTELATQFEESALLEKRIRENLEGIGFTVLIGIRQMNGFQENK
ncbi:hypothetical protein [Pontibacter diazotrophicus]|uniref:hypothetical protein n=1 Tax=Pontibacter diazotrophicus TaxID=1400979 RepID=UPI001FE4DB49|nr:hypothetical protein [Pontibacter diazotrophicus]